MFLWQCFLLKFMTDYPLPLLHNDVNLVTAVNSCEKESSNKDVVVVDEQFLECALSSTSSDIFFAAQNLNDRFCVCKSSLGPNEKRVILEYIPYCIRKDIILWFSLCEDANSCLTMWTIFSSARVCS